VTTPSLTQANTYFDAEFSDIPDRLDYGQREPGMTILADCPVYL